MNILKYFLNFFRLAIRDPPSARLPENFPVNRSAISQHLLLLAEVGMAQLRDSQEMFWTTELDQLVADAVALASPGTRTPSTLANCCCPL